VNRAAAPVWGFVPGGWRNTVMPPEVLELAWEDTDVTVRYQRRRDGVVEATVGGGRSRLVRVHGASGGLVDIVVDGRRMSFTVERAGRRWFVHGPGGDLDIVELPRFPLPESGTVAGGQVAPMPGRVVTVRVGVGDEVAAGQVLVVIEAMKMEHSVTAPEAGVVTEILVGEGDQVDNGALLIVVAGD
jgi:propionyl-CoA carboxylase alpha chain